MSKRLSDIFFDAENETAVKLQAMGYDLTGATVTGNRVIINNIAIQYVEHAGSFLITRRCPVCNGMETSYIVADEGFERGLNKMPHVCDHNRPLRTALERLQSLLEE